MSPPLWIFALALTDLQKLVAVVLWSHANPNRCEGGAVVWPRVRTIRAELGVDSRGRERGRSGVHKALRALQEASVLRTCTVLLDGGAASGFALAVARPSDVPSGERRVSVAGPNVPARGRAVLDGGCNVFGRGQSGSATNDVPRAGQPCPPRDTSVSPVQDTDVPRGTHPNRNPKRTQTEPQEGKLQRRLRLAPIATRLAAKLHAAQWDPAFPLARARYNVGTQAGAKILETLQVLDPDPARAVARVEAAVDGLITACRAGDAKALARWGDMAFDPGWFAGTERLAREWTGRSAAAKHAPDGSPVQPVKFTSSVDDLPGIEFATPGGGR